MVNVKQRCTGSSFYLKRAFRFDTKLNVCTRSDSLSDSDYVLSNEPGGSAESITIKPEIKSVANIPAKYLKPSQKQLREMGLLDQDSKLTWHERRNRKKFKFTRFVFNICSAMQRA